MELLEGQDPDKKKLIETSDRHKQAMKKEIGELTKKTDRMIKNALIIGGSLVVTYFIISALSKKSKKKKKKIAQGEAAKTGEGIDPIVEDEVDDGPSVLGQVGTQLLNQASLMVLDIARQKLSEYIATRNKPDEHS